jgi:hypothetical protein
VRGADLPSETAECNLEQPPEKYLRVSGLSFLMQSWLCTREHLNPEVVNIFYAAARYRRATVCSSHNDAHPDNSALHTGKFTLFRCTSADVLSSCCGSIAAPRQQPGCHGQIPAKNNEQKTSFFRAPFICFQRHWKPMEADVSS